MANGVEGNKGVVSMRGVLKTTVLPMALSDNFTAGCGFPKFHLRTRPHDFEQHVHFWVRQLQSETGIYVTNQVKNM